MEDIGFFEVVAYRSPFPFPFQCVHTCVIIIKWNKSRGVLWSGYVAYTLEKIAKIPLNKSKNIKSVGRGIHNVG